MDFLADNCVAGQTLLRLVSRGNAILAELMRLSENVPTVFLGTNPHEMKKYQDIMFDFRYLKSAEYYEEKIDKTPALCDLDTEFRENHLDILKRFYLLFESVYKYITDFNRYLEELEEGVFIQLTLDAVMLNTDGKQLVSEAIYLYGVMLITLDLRIPGPVRERILISWLRYKGQTETPLIDEVCKLCRHSGFLPGKPKPQKYPESFFNRIPIPRHVVHMVVGRLRSDDIYNQVSAYPLPDHRSTALATQAAMLYVILFFVPEILAEEQAVMREIVDKHFPDNWIIAYYLGYTVDLSIEWLPYKAATMALANTLQINNIQGFVNRHWRELDRLMKVLKDFLTEGVMVHDYVLERNNRLMATARECNVTLRWLLMHDLVQNPKVKQIIAKGYDKDKLLVMLLKTAQYEFTLRKLYQELLDSKEERWDACKKEGCERMRDLADYFSGEKALTRVKKNESLRKWFSDIAEKVNLLDFHDSTSAGRKIQQLIQAMEEVEQFHQIETDLQVKQFLKDTRAFLHQMIRIVNIQESYLGTLALVSDMSYAWNIVHDFVPMMQEQIKRDPTSVIMLRSTFLKLSSIMDLPLVRINQAQSPDLLSVSEYYSSELVAFVRTVLSIIPRSMFLILNEIIALQTGHLQEMPTRCEKEQFKNFAQLPERYKLARATHAISVFTEGMLAMENTLVGVIEVHPKQLLEDGIRKELVMQIAGAMDRILRFKTPKPQELIQNLHALTSQLDGFRRSFQYIQDYVNIYGLKIWQEEFSRIVHFNVEQECNSFLKKKTYEWQSQYQSEAIPIPTFPPVDSHVNFIGRLAQQLEIHTDYQRTVYLDQMSAWYDERGEELIGIRTFTLLLDSVGVFGVTGLDQLFCFMNVKNLQDFVEATRGELKSLAKYLEKLHEELEPTTTIPTNTDKLYVSAMTKSNSLFHKFLGYISRIGQYQLIRRQIASLLNFACKIDSKTLYHGLEACNLALLNDIKQHYQSPDEMPYPDEDDNPLVMELSKYLETCGINDPLTKIYITTDSLDQFPLLIFLFVIYMMPKFTYNKHLAVLQPVAQRRKGGVDATPFIVGLITVLKQFHSIHTQKFLAYLGQYVRAWVNYSQKNTKLADLPPEAINVLLFLEVFCKFNPNIDRKVLEGYLPPYIFDHFTH